MKSRWTKQGAQQAVQRWGGKYGEGFALRLYSARLMGQEADLVLHGGGNVSFKGTHRTLLGDEVEAVYVKASGAELTSLEPDRLPGIDLEFLRRLRSLDALTDEEMAEQFRLHLLDPAAATPSIETLVHAFLPHRFIDHSHADAVLALTNQPEPHALIREALGDRVAVVPYVRAGFELARAVADVYEANPKVVGIVLVQHGLITFGDDARESYERHTQLVDACERFINERRRGRALTPGYDMPVAPAELAARAAPMLRGLVALPTGDEDRPYRRSVLEWRAGGGVLAFVDSKEAKALAATGAITGDHLIRTKPSPLFVEDPKWSDEQALRKQLQEAVETYRRDYEAYMTARGGSAGHVDSSPRVVLLPGAGIFCWGRTKRDAVIAADITEHTLAVKTNAHLVGTYASLAAAEMYDMEHRAYQQAKVDSTPDRPLESQVVVISGGGGAIGAAVAQCCARAGAHVAIADLDEKRIEKVAQAIERKSGCGSAIGIKMDVTDEASVRDGFAEVVRTFGGVDVIVPNAGIAHVAPIEDLQVADFRRLLDVNAVGYLLFMREGIRILKQQGLGGHIIINASKNVFGPGKDFGAYSASKAAGHQLGKVAAIELAPFGIRVNMINADAVFGDEECPSGLWKTVGPQRAKSRGMSIEELPEYYRKRNLLSARVCGHHVGNAVVFFASNATPTTGATLPVDGGVVEAFPR